MHRIVNIIIDFFPFCFKPNWEADNKSNTLLKILSTFIFIMILTVLNISFVFISRQLPNHFLFSLKFSAHDFSPYMLVVVLMAGPIFEEIIFRLPLIYTRLNFSLAIGVLVGFLLISIFIQVENNYLRLLSRISFAVFISAIIYFILIKIKAIDIFLNKLFTNYRIIAFYFLALSFCLVHITNINNISSGLLLLILLYLLPKLISGLNLSYIRIKFGLKYSIMAHIGHNLIGGVLLYLFK